MNTYPLLQIDAFTTQPLQGNPCAVVFDADSLDAETMLAIAREMNLSETAFVLHSDKADFRARYFTPAEEIPLAGHPTIATVYGLIETGRLNLMADHQSITLELQAGVIHVEIYSEKTPHCSPCKVKRIVMAQKKPIFLETFAAEIVMPVFGLQTEDALPGVPIQVVSTGTPQLMIPVRELDILRRINMDIPAYTALRRKGAFFSPHLFCLGGATERGNTFARHFGVPPDSPEDPFTGSATGGMGAYLWRYGLIEKPVFVAEQGHWMHRPGEATVEVIGAREEIETVKVGGPAVTVMRGELTI
ncbi:MAG: PhzF family phenazine biosynthesis protein [Anaerolineales bacterium]|nr:PhzF family phenazine biosynthesis protein [Anaerolineales bacterium]